MASGPITSWQIDGETVERVSDFIYLFIGSSITAAMKLKDTCSLEESVKVTQSCLTLCNPRGCSLPGSSVHGSLQAGILEWVAMASSRGLPNPGI